jgi:uncharacterized protein GlcG (DUF336 family)
MQPSLGLTQARQIADEAVSDAGRLQLRISVAVTDEAGALLAFARMDGATRLSARRQPDEGATGGTDGTRGHGTWACGQAAG